MQEQQRLGDKNQPHIVQIMTTEHYNLQSARSLVTSEQAGRSSLFLSTVTTALVALALVAQISALGTAFFVFALVLFPSLFFLGLVTFQRTFQIALADFIYTRGINRIRHLYVELAPQVQDYFILSTHDDEASIMQDWEAQAIWWQAFVSTPGMIAVIDSILGGIFMGLLVYQLFSLSLLLCCTVGFVVFLGILAALYRYLLTTWRRFQRNVKPLFPTPVQVE
ncbi:MAG: hypothetical protein E6I91_00600 [Chloroflexi bacterium]|nr:MAG: hypothetical protein E6I91_00600 [Chloroflexota bacterium]